MKKFIVALACVCFLTAAKKEPELVVSAQDCLSLAVPAPAVAAEYQPGVDVHGKPVMEADLTPSSVKPPDKYSFDLTVDIARHIGLTVPAGMAGEAKIGAITIENGQVKFNGSPMEGDAEAALKALCTRQSGRTE